MIKISKNKRFFQQNGEEFFYLGDTAWQLLAYLTKEEIDYYFRIRASQGFNAVQFVLLPEFDGLRKPNVYGDLPLLDYTDKIVPNPRYFEFALWCVECANSYGLTVGLLPTWGDKINQRSGAGPEIFNEGNTYEYAKFVSDYFAGTNLIFYLGGDKNPEVARHYAVFEEFVKGIKAGGSKEAIISYHCKGGYCSNDFYNETDWLDFSIFQSGHTKYALSKSDRMKLDHVSPSAYMYAEREVNRKVTKPFMDGEPAYEDSPQMCVDEKGVWGPIRDPELVYFTDHDVRKDAYWTVFGGAAGITYGANDIWQFTSRGNKNRVVPASLQLKNWKVALQLSGAQQMKHLMELLKTFEAFTRRASQELLISQSNHEQEAQAMVCTDDQKCIMVYTPVEQQIEISTINLKAAALNYSWFDPKNGQYTEAVVVKNTGILQLQTPIGLDYVLVIKVQEKTEEE